MLVMELAKDYMKDNSFNFMLSYEVRDITWEEEVESLKDGILGQLANPKGTGRLEMEESVARAIQERLLNEIPAEGFIKMGKDSLCCVYTYESELKPGDPPAD